MELREPKKKRVGSHIKLKQPFPILIESENYTSFGNDIWPMFTGHFTGDSVIVCDPEEMVSLYTMGFFGRGSYTRGYPSFGKTKKGVPPVIKERQWERRKLWMEKIQKELSNSKDQEFQDNINENSIDTEKGNTSISNQSNQSKTTESEVKGFFGRGSYTRGYPKGYLQEFGKTKKERRRERRKLWVEKINKVFSDLDQEMEDKIKKYSICVGGNTPISNQSDQSKTTESEVTPMEDEENESETTCPTNTNKNSLNDVINSVNRYSETTEVDIESKVLVIADSDDEDLEKVIRNPQPHLEDEIIKTVAEVLNLTLEEAFFLSYALGCLHLIDMTGNAMTLKHMWHTFCEIKPNFIELYVAYHYFRAEGWVVKTGHKFGGDFLLYKLGPAFYHASYIVLVESVNNKLEKVSNAHSWTKLHGLHRLAENSGKDVIICQVLVPDSLTSDDLLSPKCLHKCQVNELLTKRWISSQEREEKET